MGLGEKGPSGVGPSGMGLGEKGPSGVGPREKGPNGAEKGTENCYSGSHLPTASDQVWLGRGWKEARSIMVTRGARHRAIGEGRCPALISRRLGLASLLVLLLVQLWPLAAGCGKDHPGVNNNNNQATCPEGHRAEGPACVPIFDDPASCPGPNEMPALGGGCRPVGVLHCAEGFVADGEGGCEPILPERLDPCPAGTMERIGQIECQPVGVLQCAEGFVTDGEGGCDAILPPGPDPCPHGTIELIGHNTCQPLGDCGPDPSEGGSPWGLVEVDATTMYVDATADATGANGTVAAPFLTVAEALAEVPPGGQVAIAAGEYEEALVVSRPVRLAGRCSALVVLRSPGDLDPPRPTLRITSGGTGSEVQGVTLTGPGEGLRVSGAQQVSVQEVEIPSTGSYGVLGISDADARLWRVKVTGATTLGILSNNSTLSVEQSVVRGTNPQPATGYFGRGIEANCTSVGSCTTLHVEGSLVAGNRDIGIFAFDVDAVVISSVVRDTLPEVTGQGPGMGINAQCNSDLETCGSMLVEGSLVKGNRDTGILVMGVHARVASSVVRDTLPRMSDRVGGRGISAQCHPTTGVCGSLRVEGSLVADNHEFGIEAVVSETQVVSSIVRDTQSQEGDQTYGLGIAAFCNGDLGIFGSLRIEGCLVAGNHTYGIYASGVEARVVSSVVRNTQPQLLDAKDGIGIAAQCYPGVEVCGSLDVESSLITANREMGIFASGADARVVSSVVRDTLPQESDQAGGRGIVGQCDARMGICGSMHVQESLVAHNRELGLVAYGVHASVISTTVRNTLPQQSDNFYGSGIAAQCDELVGACGSLLVESSLVAENRSIGIFAVGVDATVISSVVRDTLQDESDLSGGRGINSQCHSDLGICSRLHVEESLVTGNRDVGVVAHGSELTMLSSVVHDTRARLSDLAFGRGITSQCDDRVSFCGRLRVTDTLVTQSEDVGIYISGAQTELEGVVVLDTATNSAGPLQGEHGQGIWAICHPVTGECGTLSMTSCLVASSHGAGVALEGVSGFMTASLVDRVLAQPADGKYGYGIQIGGLQGEDLPVFHVSECTIRDAKLVGVLYYRSKGMLSGSVVSGGEYSVAMNEGSSPTIGQDNQLSGTVRDDPQWVSLYPSPAPPPATPALPLSE